MPFLHSSLQLHIKCLIFYIYLSDYKPWEEVLGYKYVRDRLKNGERRRSNQTQRHKDFDVKNPPM
jgi:hypothetical protein